MIIRFALRPHRLNLLHELPYVPNGSRCTSAIAAVPRRNLSHFSLPSNALPRCHRAINPSNLCASPNRAQIRMINRYAKTVPLAPPITSKTRLTEYPIDNELEDYPQIHFIDEEGRTKGIVNPRSVLSRFNRTIYHLVMLNSGSVREAEEKQGMEGAPEVPIPICRLITKAELRSDLNKKRDQLLKKKEKLPEQVVKEIQVGWAITQNDLSHRLKRMTEFLGKGNKVQVLIAPKKGMARVEQERMQELLKAFRSTAEEVGATEFKHTEGEPGGKVMMFFLGKKPEAHVVKENPKEERARKAMERKERREQKERDEKAAQAAAALAATVQEATVQETSTQEQETGTQEAATQEDAPWRAPWGA